MSRIAPPEPGLMEGLFDEIEQALSGTGQDAGESTGPPPELPPAPRGTPPRVVGNLQAIEALCQLRHTGGEPGALQLARFAAWSGWGACPQVFDPGKPGLAWARDWLRDVLTPGEYRAAERSTLNAHYTAPHIVRAMWEVMRDLGFTGGTVLEPGCGSGNFIAAAPPGTGVTGIELDPITAAIAAARCPGADIWTGSFAPLETPPVPWDAGIGNVPFGKVALFDPVHNGSGQSIHNHFIYKALHMIAPGGLLAVITSRYTMDSRDQSARLQIAELADLVGAVRLPSAAHRATAGTDVVSDILILRRRREGEQPADMTWVQTALVTIDGRELPASEYFLAHPGQVLGVPVTKDGMRRRDGTRETVLVVRPHGDLEEQLPVALAGVGAWGKLHGLTHRPSDTGASRPAESFDGGPAHGVEEGHIRANPDWTFSTAEGGWWQPYPVTGSVAVELRSLLGLRDAAAQLLDAESATAVDTPHIAALRERLNARFDEHVGRFGPLGRFTLRHTGRTDPDTGQPKLARVFPRSTARFRRDPLAPLVYALEVFDPDEQTGSKAAIFRERVVAPRTPAGHAENPGDALAICVDALGRADVPEIARLLGVSEADALEALGDLVFTDPGTGDLIPAPEYLSGYVRAKLRAAEAAALDSGDFRRNVEALRAVIPADLTAADVDARLGAAWIEAKFIQQFLTELLEDRNVRVQHPGGQIWRVEGDRDSVRAISTWGTGRMPAPKLAQRILEQRPLEVHDTVLLPGGGESRILSVEETLAAVEKGEEMREAFTEWVWKDPERAKELLAVYNETFNGIALRNYDGIKLSLPGLSVAFHPRAHQYAAVARIRAEPAVLLAHEVGAGKTAEMVMGATELRRLGLITKPMVVVPNHMLDQFAGDWLRCYPQARILIGRKEELRGDARRRFVARCATGNWDGIIISHSAFERIPLTAEEQNAYIVAETEKYRQWIEECRDRQTVKQLQRVIWAAEEALKKKMASARDQGITFEAMGVDYLLIDEAHYYKNLRNPSAIPDARIDGALKSTDLAAKLSCLRARQGKRIVTLATATPVSNSVSELFVMQSYLRPDLLEMAGIQVFDTWAATFGETVTGIELAPEGGSSFHSKTRFARFKNVPEMLRMFWVAADVKTAEDLDLPVPALAAGSSGVRGVETIAVPPSPELVEYVRELGERAEAIRKREVSPEDDNMLAICGDGRKASLHLWLVELEQTVPGKIERAAQEIARIWEKTRGRRYPLNTERAEKQIAEIWGKARASDDPAAAERAVSEIEGIPFAEEELSPVPGVLQLVFCDQGTPKPGEWSPYEELRSRLVDLGMPAAAIRFIHEAKTDRDKAMLFASARAGHISVLVGSTGKMGIGTNVQTRALALHDLDAPWRPADIAQRHGRIIRPGNLNAEIHLRRYVTKGSFDAFMWQTLQRKAAFIAQVMSGKLDVREIEDLGDTALSFAEVKAIATDNPLLMDKAKADTAVAKLRRGARAWKRNQSLLHSTIRGCDQQIAELEKLILELDRAVARRTSVAGDNFTFTLGDEEIRDREQAARRLAEVLRGQLEEFHTSRFGGGDGPVRRLGEFAGFPLMAVIGRLWGNTFIDLFLHGAPYTELHRRPSDIRKSDGGTVPMLEALQVLENRVNLLPERIRDAQDKIQQAHDEIRRAEETIGAPYPKQAELAEAEARLKGIDEELAAIAAENNKQADEATRQLADANA